MVLSQVLQSNSNLEKGIKTLKLFFHHSLTFLSFFHLQCQEVELSWQYTAAEYAIPEEAVSKCKKCLVLSIKKTFTEL